MIFLEVFFFNPTDRPILGNAFDAKRKKRGDGIKNKKKNSSTSVLNFYNFTILRSVFCSRNVCVSTEIYTLRYSFIAYVAFSSCLRREDQFVVFFPTRSTRICRCDDK